jgi:energy-converting hydrogenase Eha subunit F
MFGLFGKKTPSTDQIVPRIKHTNFVAALKPIAAKDPGSMPLTEPLVADLLISYALDLPQAF